MQGLLYNSDSHNISKNMVAQGFDISFFDKNGNKVQPKNGNTVDVRFTAQSGSSLSQDDKDYQKASDKLAVYHVEGKSSLEKMATFVAPQKGASTQVAVKASGFSPYVVARNLGAPADGKMVDVKITKFEIQNTDHTTAKSLYHTDTFLLMMNWDASSLGSDIHQGDYFDVTLPDAMWFPSDTTKRTFNLTDSNGNVVATAHVNPGPMDAGGKIHVVFGKGVENKYDVKGTMYLAAKFNKSKIKLDENNSFSITVNGEVSGHTQSTGDDVIIKGPQPLGPEYLSKWGGKVKGEPNQAWWHARFNHIKKTLNNVVITDTMGDSGETFIPESFVLKKVTFDKYGNVKGGGKQVDLSSILSFSDGGKTFTVNLGTIGPDDQYTLEYKSTYTPGITLKNKLRMDFNGTQKIYIASHRSADSGGSAGGNLASKIKLIKVDSENNKKTAS